MIPWWDRDQNSLIILLLVNSRIELVVELNGNANKPHRAIINELYVARHDSGKYGTGKMFTTRIGIAGHMLRIKDLVSGYNSCVMKRQRILVI
jgi:hypothetical protein